MKKIFTLLASFILAISLFAAAPRPKTMLTIQSYDQTDIRVLIDGRRFEPNTSYLRIRDLQPGYHQVKVYRERRSGRFTIFGNKYDMVFNSSMYVRPQTNIMIIIDRNGRAQISENRMNGRNNDWDDRNRSWGNNNDYDFDRGRNYGDYDNRDFDQNDRDSRWDGRNRNGGSNNGGGYGNGGYGNGGSNNGGGYGNGGYGNNSGYGRQMSDYDFSRAVNSISMQRGDFQKMESAKQLISTGFFSSAQVKQMLQVFSFENDKLDLAKLAYDKTVDKQNFYVVNDVFNSYSSRDELARYTRSH
jgi:hypothetical protein